ncbi:MAG: ATP-dependent helicase HrpB [Candidatus Latescibacterota bacterium]|nr:ATP-dependent helicase HrpB [Candidatus Latescibacterota bacterium]
MLPILAHQEEILTHLAAGNRLVLTAPTGSGKTTQIPQILHRARQARIAVLQPRRLATRLVAQRVADELEVELGGLVGYQTRHDSHLSAATRIRFLTEGLFLRLLQSDPELKAFDIVVLDEFHERSLAADAALGLLCRLQEKRRPDLALITMSATLDSDRLAAHLQCPTVIAHGRLHPIDIRYRPTSADQPPWDRAADALHALLAEGIDGDVLVFMPGAYEIRRTIEAAQAKLARLGELLDFRPLHGSLSAREQDAAIAPGPRRKIVVATNVAETSITIEGIRHVVDSGLARVHRHDPRRGIDSLLIEAVSQASAQQRAGRAGRTAPGSCTRLWSSEAQTARPERDAPEIRRVDLADAALQLISMGIADLRDFPWLDAPEPQARNRATNLLRDLDALTSDGQLTDLGRQMAHLPVHPRLARFLIAAAQRRCLDRATVWAALAGERDILLQPIHQRYTHAPDGEPAADLVVRERALHRARDLDYDPAACARQGLNGHACRQADQTARLYRAAARRTGLDASGRGSSQDLLKCLLIAFFDRVALRRNRDNLLCAMAGQRRVELDPKSAAREAEALIALEIRELEARRENNVRTALSLANAIDVAWLEEIHPKRISLDVETTWDAQNQAVAQAEVHRYDDLVYRRAPLAEIDTTAAAEILVARIAAGQLRLEKWNADVEQWILRTRLLQRLFPQRELVAYDEDELQVVYHEIVAGCYRYSQIRNRDCLPYVQNALPWQEQQFVEQMAPVHHRLPSGVRMKIEYSADGPPRGRAKIQELYDIRQTPAIAGGRQQLLLEILGPNFRPVQVTDDGGGFGERT